MGIGYWIVKGDKTSCGGSVIEGTKRKQFHSNYAAMNGFKVSCGKHPGTYRIEGGHSGDELDGNYLASTLYSRSTCPCKTRFIPSQTWAWHGPYQDSPVKAATPAAAKSTPDSVQEPEQHAQATKKQNSYADNCKP